MSQGCSFCHRQGCQIFELFHSSYSDLMNQLSFWSKDLHGNDDLTFCNYVLSGEIMSPKFDQVHHFSLSNSYYVYDKKACEYGLSFLYAAIF